ncbi:MAG: hypothetical protein QF464_14940, partial [Myxococcota bacterium]|nr:hypothetical protein [Myxococcota bacterium]
HESEFGYRSPPRGPYSGLEAMISSGLFGGDEAVDLGQMLGETELLYDHRQPRFAIAQQEVYLRWVYKGAGVDLGAYFASFLDPQGTLAIDTDAVMDSVFANLAGDVAPPLALVFDHKRYHMLGFSGAWPHHAFLFKWELSMDIQRPIGVLVPGEVSVFGASQAIQLPGVARREAVNLMVGVTWSGIEHLVVGVEFMKPTLLDDPDGMLFDPNAPTFAIRASYQALDERLTLSAAAFFAGWYREQGWMVRGDVTYDIIDALQVGIGYITYQPGSAFGAFYGLARHDRLFIGLRWDFQVL